MICVTRLVLSDWLIQCVCGVHRMTARMMDRFPDSVIVAGVKLGLVVVVVVQTKKQVWQTNVK